MFIDIFPPVSMKFNVHEMDKDYSGWSLKHRVDLTQVMTKFLERIQMVFSRPLQSFVKSTLPCFGGKRRRRIHSVVSPW